MKKHTQTIAIWGLGLIGGSLAKALKSSRARIRIVAVGRNLARLKKARRLGLCDAITLDSRWAAAHADIIVLALPVNLIIPTLSHIAPSLKPKSIVMDVGSVKEEILSQAQKIRAQFKNSFYFVGTHPMAGLEKTGFEYADTKLFRGATTVICPENNPSSVVQQITKLWRQTGSYVLQCDAKTHDRVVSKTSHLPHLLSSIYTMLIAQLQRHTPKTSKVLAGSFRDFTRIAMADPEQWAFICQMNQKNVLSALKIYRDSISKIISNLKQSPHSSKNWLKIFQEGKKSKQFLDGYY